MFRQHYVVPELALVSDIAHIALAFMRSSVFNAADVSERPLFTTVEMVRPQFADGTAIMSAMGIPLTSSDSKLPAVSDGSICE